MWIVKVSQYIFFTFWYYDDVMMTQKVTSVKQVLIIMKIIGKQIKMNRTNSRATKIDCYIILLDVHASGKLKKVGKSVCEEKKWLYQPTGSIIKSLFTRTIPTRPSLVSTRDLNEGNNDNTLRLTLISWPNQLWAPLLCLCMILVRSCLKSDL